MGEWFQPSGKEEISKQDEKIDTFYMKIKLISAYQKI